MTTSGSAVEQRRHSTDIAVECKQAQFTALLVDRICVLVCQSVCLVPPFAFGLPIRGFWGFLFGVASETTCFAHPGRRLWAVFALHHLLDTMADHRFATPSSEKMSTSSTIQVCVFCDCFLVS